MTQLRIATTPATVRWPGGILVTRDLLAHYRGSEIHNEILHDGSQSFATDGKYPESDHAPAVATFDLP